MCVTRLVQLAVEVPQFCIDPRVCPICTPLDHACEILIDGDRKLTVSKTSRKAPGNVETVQWKDAAKFGIDPEKLGVIAVFGHRKDPDGITVEKKFRGKAHANAQRAKGSNPSPSVY